MRMVCAMMEVRVIVGVVLSIMITSVQTQQGSVLLNKYCRNKSDCAFVGYICGQNQTCQCDRLFVVNKYGDKCVGGVEQKCLYDDHCIEGAFCQHQLKCKCKELLYPTEDKMACSRSKQLISSQPHLYVIASSVFCLLKFA